MGRDEKFWSKTERDDLNSSGPPKPGPGYDVPPKPPTCRPCLCRLGIDTDCCRAMQQQLLREVMISQSAANIL